MKKPTQNAAPAAKRPAPKAKKATVAKAAAKEPARQSVKLAPAKGRPMLSWVGKRALREVTAFPAQEVERFAADGAVATLDWSEWPDRYAQGGLLFHGDNKEVLAHLLANGFRGKVDLVYIDPPFDSGADYVRRVQLRGVSGTARLDGAGYTLGEQIQYTDIWANDSYLQFMYERLQLLKELLSPAGTLYLHLDLSRAYMMRLVLDEIFGRDGYRNEIAWQRTTAHSDTRGRFGEIHDSILVYARGDRPLWTDQHIGYSDSYRDAKYTFLESETGRRYRLDNTTAPGPRPNLEYEWRGVRPPAGRCWAISRHKMEEYEREGRLVYSKTGMPQYKRYLDEMRGVPIQDVWTDIPPVNPMAEERLAYPTQKPEALLERIVRASSQPGSTVVDAFMGSGTTVAVAQKLGRRWIGCDINQGAIQTTTKRLIDVMREQAESGGQGTLELDGEQARPAQLAFAAFRVNDYDLAIQHNEAVNLACEHMGVVRTRTDAFFDGTLGKRLVKIVPFDHPISPADLDEIAREIRSRPGEERDITAVGLGKELACDVWLAEHNRRGAPNQIALVELRSDPKYGKLFAHQPAAGRLAVTRDGRKATVVIEEFVSPTIVERLAAHEGIVAPRITDWRSMVDSVMIDAHYDGKVFEVALADVPERKDALVSGRYELELPARSKRVAVKITDMLGEELLLTAEV